MIYIKSNNANEAWIQTFKRLYSEGVETDNQKYFRDEFTVIELDNPSIEIPDPRFPMSKSDLDTINRYIHSGEHEELVTHEWTKIYYHRIFDEPNNQYEFMKRVLLLDEPRGESLISMWDKSIDQDGKVTPCTEIVWGRIKNQKLEFHIHAHSSDAYKKLLMNMQEFISLQKHMATDLGIGIGKYYHILDSCHLHYKDLNEIKVLFEKIDD